MKSFKEYIVSTDYMTEGVLQTILRSGVNIVLNALIKEFDKKLYPFGEEKLQDGSYGVRYGIGNSTAMIRFRYKDRTIVAVDYWKSGNDDFDTPSFTLETNGVKIFKLAPYIIDMIKKPTPQTIEITESVIEEAVKTKKTVQIKPGKHVVSTPIEYEKLKKQVDAVKYADPQTIYKDLDSMIAMLTKNLQYSIIVTGASGQGKSFSVEKALKDSGLEDDTDYEIYKGSATPKGLYTALFLNNRKILVVDDLDAILKDEVAVNILKAALDSKPVRKISWVSSQGFDSSGMSWNEMLSEYDTTDKLPWKFEYTGKIIFISNLPQSKFDKALLSRSMSIDITLKPSDMLKRIEAILPSLNPESGEKPSIEIKKEVLNFMKQNKDKIKEELNFRGYLQALKFRMSGSPDWKRLASNYAIKMEE